VYRRESVSTSAYTALSLVSEAGKNHCMPWVPSKATADEWVHRRQRSLRQLIIGTVFDVFHQR
jgi:hypothetical protein